MSKNLVLDRSHDIENPETKAKVKEVCRAREEFCDYFNGNSLNADPKKMMRYYDQFATLVI